MSEGIPLQQGLRHIKFWVFSPIYVMSEGIPLQQGLRRANFLFEYCQFLSEGIPLQQGLRLSASTRRLILLSQRVFHYNRD